MALAAGVSEATVFNYFASKEDLFFERLDRYGLDLVDAVAARPAGESALAAFRRLLLGSGGLLGQAADDPRARDRLRTVNRVIADSPALRAREELSYIGTADALAARLPGDPLQARVVAHSLVAVQRSLVQHVRARLLGGAALSGGSSSGAAAGDLASDVAAKGEKAFALLERGLGDYGIAA
ncbi:TetR/AcrR family transcriptional regulator [Paractinoplanes atraurantiacus]|uniref:Regulatory protein, tetR family n=1 Tax=Paractinoplanes atraurantiacus TaxID=1036182 RepID=A0A285IIS3_9ACTN|nr:TetR family transcriptional regulator [Actinoplanes atraurantiacus]SNY47803.1 regulatory protein, tetR family [Actinoplanes atraurantiacus]